MGQMGMHWNKKKRWAGVAAAALLLTGGVGFGPTPVAAVTPADSTDFVSRVPAGYLDLQLRTSATGVVSGQVSKYSSITETVADATQTFTITRCEVTGTTGPELLRFSSSVGHLGIYNNGLGSKTKGNCTPAEGRTSAGEALTVAFGSALLGSPLKIDAAQLDIEGKFSAGLAWSLDSGPTSAPVSLATSNDNGPDAGTGDNTMVTVGAKGNPVDDFTSMVLSTPVGEFALDGGGDGLYTQNWAGNSDSIFVLTSSTTYDYTVGCKTAVTADSGDIGPADRTDVDDSLVFEVTYVRQDNKDQTECAPIGVTIMANDTPTVSDEVFVDNSTTFADGTTQNVRARVKIVWIVQTAGKDQLLINDELDREIQFTEGGQRTAVSNCTDVPAEVWSDPLGPMNPASTARIQSTVPWCLMSDSRVVSGTTIIQTQYYSGNGDPRWA